MSWEDIKKRKEKDINTSTKITGNDNSEMDAWERIKYEKETGTKIKTTTSSKTIKEDEEEDTNKWFKKSNAYDDDKGNWLTDTAVTIGSTLGDVGVNLVKGAGGLVEGVGDLATYGIADVVGAFGNETKANQMRTNAKKSTVDAIFNPLEKAVDKNSVFGDKSDSIVEGLGYVAAITGVSILTGGAGAALGASSATAATVGTTATTFVSAMGNNMSQALNDGATLEEARIYGAIAGAAEAGSELMFGGLGKVSKAMGLSKGALDDVIVGGLTKNIKNKLAKTVVQTGLKAGGEGFEEVVSGFVSAIAKKATYMKDEEFSKILSDEKLGEQFFMGALTSAIAQGPSTIRSVRNGTDIVTGRTENEQKVYDSELNTRKEAKTREATIEKAYNEQIKTQENLGVELTEEAKAEIRQKVENAYDNGTLESIELNKKDLMKIEEQVEKDMEDGNISAENIMKTLGENQDISKDNLLMKSMYENEQKYNSYQVEQTDNEKVNVLMQSAADAGMNNTSKTRKKVELISKLTKDTDRQYKFVSPEQLKQMGYNENANGLIDKSTGEILINAHSDKGIQSIVGHETTHIFDSKTKGKGKHAMAEYSKEYQALQDAAIEYAKVKGIYESKVQSITNAYGSLLTNESQIKEELTADLVGDFLFNDEKFIEQLSVKNKNIFQKIYDYIKHAYTIAKGTDEEKAFEELKNKFEKVYKTVDKTINTNADVKYSFLGEEMLGNNSEAMGLLKEAKRMKDNGENPEYIRQTTGWMIGNDGNWKAEIDDSTAKLKQKLKKNHTYKLGDILDHKTLYALNNNYKNIEVKTRDMSGNGGYSREIGGIVLNNKILDNPKQIRSTLLHEMQHATQHAEGWQGGTSVKKAGSWEAYLNNYGEKEASEVQNRRNMTYGERRKIAPSNQTRIQYSLSDNNTNIETISDIEEKYKDKTKYLILSEHEKTNTISINNMVVKEELRNQGIGQSILNDVIEYANKNNKVITLTPTTEFNTQNRLKKWYKANGFVENKGKNTDFLISDTMYKLPDTKVQYSLSDNQGRTLTKEQQEYFKDSKVRDDDGNLLVMYHGSQSKFNEFNSSVNWFTDSEEYSNYYGRKENTIQKALGIEAKKSKNTYKTYLDIKNPKVLGNIDGYINQDFDVEEFIEASDISREDFNKLLEEYNTGKPEYEKAYRIYELTNSEVFKNYLMEQGYDGIKANEKGHTSYGVFNSNQIKKIDNTNPTNNPDIRYSLSEDNKGRKLTEYTLEKTKNSKVRDENGNLMLMYHGSPNGTYEQLRAGSYFTPNKEYAERYKNTSASSISTGKIENNPRVYEAYLNIEKPFDLSNEDARRIYIEEYIKGGNAVGINPYLSDAEYNKIDNIDWLEVEDLKDFLQDNEYDYDGIIANEGGDFDNDGKVVYRGNSYIPFSEEQIIKANNNNTEYSLTNDTPITGDDIAVRDMLKQERPTIEDEIGKTEAPTVEETITQTPEEKEQGMKEKARKYLSRSKTQFIKKIVEDFGTSKIANTKTLNAVVDSIREDIQKNGPLTKEKADSYFNELYNNLVTIDTLYYDAYKDVKDNIRATKLYISDEIKSDIADYNEFRKRNMGTLLMTSDKNNLSVDSYYQEMSDLYPELFPEDITNPSDQLEKISEVAKDITKVETNVAAYNDKYLGPDYRDWARVEFDKNINAFMKDIELADRYNAETNEKEKIGVDKETVKNIYKQLPDARKTYERVLAKELLTKEDKVQVDRLLNNEITAQEIPDGLNKKGIMNVATAKYEYDTLQKMIKEYQDDIRNRRLKLAEEDIGDLNQWEDKKTGFRYSRETAIRNIYDVAPESVADTVARKYFRSYIEVNEKKVTDAINGYNDRIKNLDIGTKNKYEITFDGETKKVSESALVQLLGEKKITEEAIKQSGADVTKIENAVKEFRNIYNELIAQINESMLDNGYAPVEYRKDYFPHFTEETTDTIIGKAAKLLGIDITNREELPTDIAGQTYKFKPGRTWFSNILQRTTDATDYDALKGFDKYVRGATDLIYHTGDIQNLRALSTVIRGSYNDVEIQNRINEIKESTMSDLDKSMAIQEVYDRAKDKSHLSKFVEWLDNYTNLLAGKKAINDRGLEKELNRQMYKTMQDIESRIAANSIGGNIGVSLTNFTPLAQAWGEVKTTNLINGIWQTMKASIAKDNSFASESQFITRRRGTDTLSETTLEKVTKPINTVLEFADNFTSEAIVRARYNQNLQEGMSPELALQEADRYTAGLMADRGRGALPTQFSNKNPISKMINMFQVEVNNQWSYYIKDLPKNMREKANANKTKIVADTAMAYTKIMVGAYLTNELLGAIRGNSTRVLPDPIYIIAELLKGLTDDDDDNDDDAVIEALTEVAGNVPFMSLPGTLIADSLGLDVGDIGRISISGAIPNVRDITEDLFNTDMTAGEKIKSIGGELADTVGASLILPYGGSQIKKTVKGLSLYKEDLPGSYTDSGDLRYTVEEDVGSKVQAALFGAYANPYAQDYIDSGFKTISKNNIDEMVGLDMNSTEYREYRKGLNQSSKTEDKLNYINSLDLTDAQKNIAANNLNKDAKTTIDMTEYGNYGSYDEYKYARDNPEKYSVISQITDYDSYSTYKSKIADIKEQYSTSDERKEAVTNYIESLNLNKAQKVMLYKMAGGYSIKSYKNDMYNYIESLPLSKEEKYTMWEELFN